MRYELCKFIEADSLMFLTVEELYEAAKRNELCAACFDAKYPTPLYKSFKEANKDGKF